MARKDSDLPTLWGGPLLGLPALLRLPRLAICSPAPMRRGLEDMVGEEGRGPGQGMWRRGRGVGVGKGGLDR